MTELNVGAARHENTLFAGLRQEWLTGEDPASGAEFSLTSGAGLGSPYLMLSVRMPDGETIREAVDVRDLVTQWVSQVLEGGS